MRLKGWFRLWVVLSVVFVTCGSIWSTSESQKTWALIDESIMKTCVDTELSKPGVPDAFGCAKRQGAYQSIYVREGTTPLKWWAQVTGLWLIADLLLTAVLLGVFFAVRWVWRGFRPFPSPT